MSEESCGPGMAAGATLPSKMASVAGAMANVLAHHLTSLDLRDGAGQTEAQVYREAVHDLKEGAEALARAAATMTAAHDLMSAHHDTTILSNATAIEVLRDFIEAQGRLMEDIQAKRDVYEGVLAQIAPGKDT